MNDNNLIHELLKKSELNLSPALLRKLLQKKINADILGQYSSRRKGQGLQFSDLREYLPGDDVKNIHWSASARTNKIQVKNYEEEKILSITCVIDLSASMNFGFQDSLYNKALEFFCQIGMLSLKTNDAIGLATFSGDLNTFNTPKQGKKNLLVLIKNLIKEKDSLINNKLQSNLTTALKTFRIKYRRRSLCFLISDFFTTGYDSELRLLANQHDLIVVFMATNPQINIPKLGLLRYQCAESGKTTVIDSSSSEIKKLMQEQELKRYKQIESLCRSAGARSIYVEDSIIKNL